MYNWSTDETALLRDPENYTIWQLEQLINFGLQGQKIKETVLRAHFSQLNLDTHRRRFLDLLLHG